MELRSKRSQRSAVLERDAGLRFALVASDLKPSVTAAKTLRGRWRRLSRPTVALHADRHAFGLGPIGLTKGLRSCFCANLGASDPAAEDNLAGLGAHGRASERALQAGASPLGLGARDASATPRVRSMRNLYSITSNQAAIAALFRVVNRYVGNLRAHARGFSGLSRACSAQPRQRTRADHEAVGYAAATEVRRAPVTNIRNTSSPRWRGGLKLESRCLVPANCFSNTQLSPTPRPAKSDRI
jgi:hypothetical protein